MLTLNSKRDVPLFYTVSSVIVNVHCNSSEFHEHDVSM